MSKHSKLDQFYTKSSIAESVVGMIDCTSYDLVLEPSAGAGDFYKLLPKSTRYGIDLAPAHPDIVKEDFFNFKPSPVGNILTIGNPPFGKNSSLAVKFFNHAAEFSDCIVFILPRTFRKPSIINRLNKNFHLVDQKLLPIESFYIPSGQSYKVPTVSQVWKKRQEQRQKIPTLSAHDDFSFVPIEKPMDEHRKKIQCDNSDFCIRRVGGAAGKIFKDYNINYRDWKSHYYIKQNYHEVEKIMSNIEWDYNESPKYDTAGNPSISKHELIKAYIKAKETHEP